MDKAVELLNGDANALSVALARIADSDILSADAVAVSRPEMKTAALEKRVDALLAKALISLQNSILPLRRPGETMQTGRGRVIWAQPGFAVARTEQQRNASELVSI